MPIKQRPAKVASSGINDGIDWRNADTFPELFELKVKGVTVDIAPTPDGLRQPRQAGEVWRWNRRTQIKTFYGPMAGTHPFPPIQLEHSARHETLGLYAGRV